MTGTRSRSRTSSRTVRTFTTSNVWPQNVQHTHTARSEVQSTHSRDREKEGERKSESIFTISLFIQARYARRSPRSTSYLSPPPLPSTHLPHLLYTRKAHIHIVNCILYLVSVSLLSVKCKVNTRYFTQICQVFAQRVWARPGRRTVGCNTLWVVGWFSVQRLSATEFIVICILTLK